MSSWNQPSSSLGGPGRRPTANPEGGNLGADDIQLHATTASHLSITDHISRAFELIKARPGETIGFTLAYLFIFALSLLPIQLVFGGTQFYVMNTVQNGQTPSMGVFAGLMVGAFLVLAVMMVVQAVLLGGLWILWLRLIRNQSIDFSDSFAVKQYAVPLMLGMLLQTLGVVAGTLLCYIPGIVLMVGWFFHGVIIVDKNLGAVDSLKASWEIMNGHKLSFVGLIILLSIINGLGMLACGLGIIVTIPLQFGAMVSFYDAIAAPGNAYLAPGEDPGSAASTQRVNDIFS